MNKNYICNSGANFVTRRKLCLTRLCNFVAEFAWKKSSVLSWEKCFCSQANGRRDVGCSANGTVVLFLHCLYRYVLYYSAFERIYWHKWTMIPGYKFSCKKWTTFTADESREDKALSSPSLWWINIWPSPSPPIIALISGFLKISWIGHIHEWRHSRRSSHLGLDLVSCEVKASGNSPGVFYNFTQNGDNRLFYDVQML